MPACETAENILLMCQDAQMKDILQQLHGGRM
jgi:hypothetical protein